ncbi:hypothetical protein [Catellatospora citrea]|uniref:Uncharacterized protein n=1 Tax=Catellatospora citrea TaxID=53366 RepID=A0A8J3KGZ8_9ACTN|nr:hypothetical protein [Catellatospora citrea]RKE09214.1 hypothetical protein C8E86_4097 [Catellatospora citrea]GIF99607.1 hypothetical protein Cci01nite_47010 [Catellatospora citrea]
MFDENEFRTLLAEADVPPTRVDTGQVLRNGRRRVRRRRLAGVGSTLAVAVAAAVTVPLIISSPGRGQQPDPATGTAAPSATAVPSPSHSPIACSVTALAMPPEHQAWQANPKFHGVEVNAADPTGRYIGGHAVIGQNFVPILWTDGVPKVLSIDPTTASIDAINEHGVVVGIAGLTDRRAYRYQAGTVTTLRAPTGKPWLYPQPDVNASGDVVMNAKPADAQDDMSRTVTALWKAGSDTPVIVPLPVGANVQGITDDGMIFGGISNSDGFVQDAYLWDQQGQGRKLAVPGGGTANAIAARGDWVTGGAWRDTQSDPVVMLWNLRTGAAKEVTSGLGVFVNSSGRVINGAPVGTVLVDGVTLTLPTVVAGGEATARALADDGTIFGDSFDGRKSVPQQWRC